MMQFYAQWSITAQDLSGITPIKARDLIVKWFATAHKEIFARVNQTLQVRDDVSLFNSAEGMVRLTFREVGADFNRPDKENLRKVINQLAKKAAGWGTPPEVLATHKQILFSVLDNLEDQ